MSWKRLDAATAQEWNALAGAAQDFSPFQSYAWGEYKRREGWTAERWVYKNSDGTTGVCLQALRKKLPLGKALIWAPGGPLIGFSKSDPAQISEALGAWLKEAGRGGVVFARFRCHGKADKRWSDAVGRVCGRPIFKLNSEHSIWFDLSQSLEALRSRMTSKHRYCVRQSEEAGLEWKLGNSPELMEDLSRLSLEMVRAKGIEAKTYSVEELKGMCAAFGENALVFAGYKEGVPVTACLTLLAGPTAFYQAAATGGEGRKLSAAYAMIGKLFEVLKARGAARLDFGGTSMETTGVNHFKKGFGGELVEYLGEWEWAASRPLRWAANALISLRA